MCYAAMTYIIVGCVSGYVLNASLSPVHTPSVDGRERGRSESSSFFSYLWRSPLFIDVTAVVVNGWLPAEPSLCPLKRRSSLSRLSARSHCFPTRDNSTFAVRTLSHAPIRGASFCAVIEPLTDGRLGRDAPRGRGASGRHAAARLAGTRGSCGRRSQSGAAETSRSLEAPGWQKIVDQM